MELPGSWFPPDQALAIVAIWRLNQQKDDLTPNLQLSLLHCFPKEGRNKPLKKKKRFILALGSRGSHPRLSGYLGLASHEGSG